MKKVTVVLILFVSFACLTCAQKPSPDSILVRPPDTSTGQPKLKGGALIDTVNIKNYPPADTVHSKSRKPKAR